MGIEPAGDLQDLNGRWTEAFDVEGDGAVLIRPDGFVAWRRRNTGPTAEADLDAAFDRVLRRSRIEANG